MYSISFYKKLSVGLLVVLIVLVAWNLLKPAPVSSKEQELQVLLSESKSREQQLKTELKEKQKELEILEEKEKEIFNELEKEKVHSSSVQNKYNEKRNTVINLPLDSAIWFFATWTAGKDSL